MRVKKDPKMRQEVFLNAAQELFFSKGYESTSVQDILNQVGNDSASPSVFYYYFKSKEAIYQAVMERYADCYVQDMTALFQEDSRVIERLQKIASVFSQYLGAAGHVGEKGESGDTGRIYLDIKDRVTGRFIQVWAEFLKTELAMKYEEETAAFLCGGISELIRCYQKAGHIGEEDAEKLVEQIISFSCRILRIDPKEQTIYINSVSKKKASEAE